MFTSIPTTPHPAARRLGISLGRPGCRQLDQDSDEVYEGSLPVFLPCTPPLLRTTQPDVPPCLSMSCPVS